MIATDSRLGGWTRGGPWKATTAEATDYPFTVIELILNGKGVGEGKMSLAASVTEGAGESALALGNDKAAPVLLKNAKREGAQDAARKSSK